MSSPIAKEIFRAVKTFAITFVVVFTLLNIPSLYANAKYYVGRIDKTESGASEQLVARSIGAVSLPVSAGTISHETAKPLPGEATLSIQKIGVTVPVLFGISSKPEQIYARLMDGVVNFSLSAKPGENGLSVLLGHSAVWLWQRDPNAASFALLDKLAPGDEAKVRYSDGREFIFVVRKSLVFNPLEGDNTEISQLENTDRPSIVLVSCYPPGNAKNRIAILAECINCKNQ